MNAVIGPKLNGPLPAAVLHKFLTNSCMQPRADWNAMGPPLPAWFRAYLRRIDPNLVLQFVPPRSFAKGGCDPDQHPFGVWAICRRMNATGWLCKRWVYSMSTPEGVPLYPTRDLVELLIRARDLWRKGQLDELENHFDRAMNDKRNRAVEESKQRMAARIEQRMAKFRMPSVMRPRVFVPGMN
jgi:hypothetical protein